MWITNTQLMIQVIFVCPTFLTVLGIGPCVLPLVVVMAKPICKRRFTSPVILSFMNSVTAWALMTCTGFCLVSVWARILPWISTLPEQGYCLQLTGSAKMSENPGIRVIHCMHQSARATCWQHPCKWPLPLQSWPTRVESCNQECSKQLITFLLSQWPKILSTIWSFQTTITGTSFMSP